MLYNRKEIPELFFIKHVHDTGLDNYVKYDEKILNKTLSPHIYENAFMSDWLNQMQPLVALLFDQMNIVKNFKNYILDKYDWRQR